MSHVASVKTVVKDLDILEKACQAIGLELVRNKHTFKWYGTWVNDYNGQNAAYRNGIDPKEYGKCEHAIRVKGGNKETYEIGVVKNKDEEGYSLVYDFWQGGFGLEKVAGKDLTILQKEYNKMVAVDQLTNLGYMVEVEELENGEFDVVGTKCW